MALLSTVLVAVLLIIVVSNRSATPAAPESPTTSTTNYVEPNSAVTHSVNVNHNETEQVVEVLAE